MNFELAIRQKEIPVQGSIYKIECDSKSMIDSINNTLDLNTLNKCNRIVIYYYDKNTTPKYFKNKEEQAKKTKEEYGDKVIIVKDAFEELLLKNMNNLHYLYNIDVYTKDDRKLESHDTFFAEDTDELYLKITKKPTSQSGGQQIDKNIYKQKYLKYKTKYFNLKR